jgi:hypothetical protein
MILRLLSGAAVLVVGLATIGLASPQTGNPPSPRLPTDPKETLSKQEELRKEFRDFTIKLEEIAERFSRSARPEDQEKARVLRRAIDVAKSQGANLQFEKMVTILTGKGGLSANELQKAIGQNDELLRTLREMLAVLSSNDEAQRLREERERLERLAQELDRIIRLQKMERAKVESGKGDAKSLAKSQEAVTKSTGELAKEMAKGGKDAKDSKGDSAKGGKDSKDAKGDDSAKDKGLGKSGKDSKDGADSAKGGKSGKDSPGDQSDSAEATPGQKDVESAQNDQKQAEQKLTQNERDEASQRQNDAIRKLEKAREELEKRLKQVREEEIERILANLQDRCQRMLAMQLEVYSGTLAVHKSMVEANQTPPRREDVQKSLQLASREADIVKEALGAIRLLEEEGSAIAFPRVFEELRDDMITVQNRLNRVDVGPFTQAIEEDIIRTLREMIESLEKSRKDNKKSGGGGGGGGGGGKQNQRLVDQLAELRMIRAMQLRINSRTAAYSREYQGEQADNPDIQRELRGLSIRQGLLEELTRRLAENN